MQKPGRWRHRAKYSAVVAAIAKDVGAKPATVHSWNHSVNQRTPWDAVEAVIRGYARANQLDVIACKLARLEAAKLGHIDLTLKPELILDYLEAAHGTDPLQARWLLNPTDAQARRALAPAVAKQAHWSLIFHRALSESL